MLVTLCTPTYNRANLLPDLYESLCKQTSFDFEWLVVDDGSVDNTEELVNSWVTDISPFNIKYIKKENGGKHTALNVGIELANGKYFAIIDSDDYLKETAIELIVSEFGKISSDEYAGIGFGKYFEDGNMVGKGFNTEYIDCTSLERRRYNIFGDKCEVFFTEIIKKYPFPVFEGEKFLTEALVWNRIANDGYKLRWLNKGFYICRYQPDGLSAGGTNCAVGKGYTLAVKELLSYKQASFVDKFKSLGVYAYLSAKNNKSSKTVAKEVECSVFFVFFAKQVYKIKRVISFNIREKKLRIKKK